MAHFDEKDFDSYYFGALTFEDSSKLLDTEDVGVFLLRDSSKGGYCLCVRLVILKIKYEFTAIRVNYQI